MWRDGQAAEAGDHFLEVAVSGGFWELENGYALTVGGPDEAVNPVEPILQALAPAPDKGWVHCGPTGSGHFAKMVHNGIEYGMMQAYTEGFALMKAREDFNLGLAAIAESRRHGSVVRSWLLDLTAEFLALRSLIDWMRRLLVRQCRQMIVKAIAKHAVDASTARGKLIKGAL